MRALVGAGLAVLLALLHAGLALGYGTATVYAGSGSATLGTWATISGAGSASDSDAAATLTEADAAGVAATTYPSNRAFTSGSSPWTASDTCTLLCSTTSAHVAGDGNPAGSIRTSFATLLGLLGLATGVGTWTSESFTWTGGTPGAVGFQLDRRAQVSGLLGLGGTASYQVSLVNDTAGTSTTLLGATLTGSDASWTTLTASGLVPGDVVSGSTYHLEIRTTFTAAAALLSGHSVSYDNVVLTVRPQNQRADGELGLAGVPAGSTMTLELRARTTGEPFAVSVYDGSGWNVRLGVSATGYAQQSYGLTSAERNGGSVRVRFLDTAQGVDDSPATLSVEFLRVVSTGGVTLSGPTALTLPAVTIDGVSPKATAAAFGQIEVADSGGVASGWSLTGTATRWALLADPLERLPADAFTAAPAAPTTPDGSDLTGVSAGAGGEFSPSLPITLMTAAAGQGVGTFRQNPQVTLSVPPNALKGDYRSTVTLTVS